MGVDGDDGGGADRARLPAAAPGQQAPSAAEVELLLDSLCHVRRQAVAGGIGRSARDALAPVFAVIAVTVGAAERPDQRPSAAQSAAALGGALALLRLLAGSTPGVLDGVERVRQAVRAAAALPKAAPHWPALKSTEERIARGSGGSFTHLLAHMMLRVSAQHPAVTAQRVARVGPMLESCEASAAAYLAAWLGCDSSSKDGNRRRGCKGGGMAQAQRLRAVLGGGAPGEEYDLPDSAPASFVEAVALLVRWRRAGEWSEDSGYPVEDLEEHAAKLTGFFGGEWGGGEEEGGAAAEVDADGDGDAYAEGDGEED